MEKYGQVEEKDFLDFTVKIKKKSLKDIKQSYNNYWDILSELVQNSVDAIIRKGNKKGIIKLTVNSQRKSITIYDDGQGIDYDKLAILLTPFSSDKEFRNDEKGEKGVGISFVIFETNYFKIKTSYMNSNTTSIGVIQNASTWVENDDNNEIKMSQTATLEKFEGTEITIKQLDSNKLFDLTLEQLIYIFRTKTAIGNTQVIFGETVPDIDVELLFIDKSGKQIHKTIPFKYMLLTEFSKKSLNYEEVMKYFEDEKVSEADKREYLHDKIVYTNGEHIKRDGVVIKYWACIAPERRVYEQISKSKHLIVDEENIDTSICFNPGVTFSIKGMPTAIDYPQPQRLGNAGYFPTFFMIINDDALILDIGRKSIPDENRPDYNNIIKDVFNHFATDISPFFSEEKNDGWRLDKVIEEVEKLPKLNTNIIKFKKSPFEQEASVAAIFFELVGSKKCFIDFIPHYSAYRGKYDLYGYYKKTFTIIEFKYHLRNIVKDFKTYRKMADELDYIVCWNVTEEDESELSKKLNSDVKITPIDFDNYYKGLKYMPEATHKISYSEIANPVYVIDLKKLLDILNKDEDAFINLKKED